MNSGALRYAAVAMSTPAQPTVLTTKQAQAYYDRFGRKQDSQDFYEGPALEDLIAHADFADAEQVFEFGCGTGRFAAQLLADHLPASAHYTGCDLSPVMVKLAAQRVAAFGDRARVQHTEGAIHFPLGDQSVDRVVSNYVLDLLSAADTRRYFDEAHRVLKPDGKLCLVSLTEGVSVASRMVCAVWSRVFRFSPKLVGGCRPIQLQPYADPNLWQSDYRAVISAFGVPSEVCVFTRQ